MGLEVGKKKVVILASWYPSKAYQNFGIFILDQARVIARVCDVMVLVPRLLGLRDLMRGREFAKSGIVQNDGLTIYREEALVPDKLPFTLRRRLYERLARRGFNKILHGWGRPDILHAHVVDPGGIAALDLGRKYDIPTVLTEHTGPFSVHLKSRPQVQAVKETLAKTDRVIAVSPGLAQQIRDFYPKLNITVVGNVVMTDFFVPPKGALGRKNPRTRFLFVGLIDKMKGVQYLLESTRLLLEGGVTNFEVLIGGKGRALRQLMGTTKKKGLTGHCYFLGMLTREEVKYWMQNCDVFVLPSLAETFGIVIGEAMACGKPIIATRCGGPEFLVTPESGFLVDVADPQALAEAMEKFVNSRVNFDGQVIRRNVVNRFGEEAFLQHVSSIYDEAIGTGAG